MTEQFKDSRDPLASDQIFSPIKISQKPGLNKEYKIGIAHRQQA